MTTYQPVTTLIRRLRSEFAAGSAGPEPRLFHAPGRVNLLGAHLDYNGGDVLPMAVDRGILVAARLSDREVIRLRSLDREPALELSLDAVGEQRDPEHEWASYPLGVWREFAGLTGIRRGVELLYAGNLPIGSGLSSSAALELATATALDGLHDTGLPREQLAIIGHRAETRYVGLRCGIMDQYASALGRAGSVLLLRCRRPSHEYVPFDPRAEVLLMDTGRPRQLADTGFNRRVAECAEAHSILRARVRDLPWLAAYTHEDLAPADAHLPAHLSRRVRHVVTEMGRMAAGVAALREGRLEALGAAMDGSHRSSAEDYEVSCEELDVITASAREVEGVHGARLTGAGFGGCAVALIQKGSAERVEDHVRCAFAARFGTSPRFEVLRPGAGCGEIG